MKTNGTNLSFSVPKILARYSAPDNPDDIFHWHDTASPHTKFFVKKNQTYHVSSRLIRINSNKKIDSNKKPSIDEIHTKGVQMEKTQNVTLRQKWYTTRPNTHIRCNFTWFNFRFGNGKYSLCVRTATVKERIIPWQGRQRQDTQTYLARASASPFKKACWRVCGSESQRLSLTNVSGTTVRIHNSGFVVTRYIEKECRQKANVVIDERQRSTSDNEAAPTVVAATPRASAVTQALYLTNFHGAHVKYYTSRVAAEFCYICDRNPVESTHFGLILLIIRA